MSTIDKVTALFAAASQYPDAGIRDQLADVFKQHASDLEEVGYETSSEMDEKLADLEQLMNEYDEAVATRREEAVEASKEAHEAEEESEGEDEPGV